MGDYTQVFKVTWEDRAFRALSPWARLIFLYSWTSDRASIGGLHAASPRDLMRAISDEPLPDDDLFAAIEELEKKPMLLYDLDNEVVWVVNRARYANTTPRTQRAIQREYRRCPDSPLKTRFARRYPWVREEATANAA